MSTGRENQEQPTISGTWAEDCCPQQSLRKEDRERGREVVSPATVWSLWAQGSPKILCKELPTDWLNPHRIISPLTNLKLTDLHLQNPFTAEPRLLFDWITGRRGVYATKWPVRPFCHPVVLREYHCSPSYMGRDWKENSWDCNSPSPSSNYKAITT